jgi:hypothetical protein
MLMEASQLNEAHDFQEWIETMPTMMDDLTTTVRAVSQQLINDPISDRLSLERHHLSEMPICNIWIEYITNQGITFGNYVPVLNDIGKLMGRVSGPNSSRLIEHAFLYDPETDCVICFTAGQFFRSYQFGGALNIISSIANEKGFKGFADFLIKSDAANSPFVLAGRRQYILDSFDLTYEIRDVETRKYIPIIFDPL